MEQESDGTVVPLEQDSMCLCPDGKIRWAAGVARDGAHGMYPAGYTSSTEKGHTLLFFDTVEVLETPEEFNRVPAWGSSYCNDCVIRFTAKGMGAECRPCLLSQSIPTKFVGFDATIEVGDDA